MGTVRGLLELTRPGNAIAAGVLTLIGAYVAGAGSGAFASQSLNASAAAVATILAVGGGNAINDYFDREIDSINQPDRPIPRGAVSPRGALVLSSVCFAVAVALALTLSLTAIAIAAIDLVALLTYTELFKGLPGVGNVIVAGLTGSTILFGAAAVTSMRGNLATVGTLSLLAALTTITREIVKDIEDITGDREEGLNTLPIAIGERPALAIASVCVLIAVLASPVPYLLGVFDIAYLVVVIPADLIMLAATVETLRDPERAQSHMKYGMFLAAAAFILGRVL